MKPADQPGAVCYTAPGCDDLPVVRVQCADYSALVSAWELTDEEVRQVQETGRIWLTVLSDRHPPVALTAACPYEAPKPKPAVDTHPLPPMVCHRCNQNYWDGCPREHEHSGYSDCYAIDDIRQCECGEYVHKNCAKEGYCPSVVPPERPVAPDIEISTTIYEGDAP